MIATMPLLALDIGSSSIKAALLTGDAIPRRIARVAFETDFPPGRAEVHAGVLLEAVADAIGCLGAAVKRADAITFAVMAPGWVAMDAKGKALTPIVTHQDRRSVRVAQEIERRVGLERHLTLAGNRPFPGGISSTTAAWYVQNQPARLKRVALVGHLDTFLVRQLTGRRAIDPSNASFTGLYDTVGLAGWQDELCDVVGVKRDWLPEIHETGMIVAKVTPEAARRFGLKQGLAVMIGCVDASAAVFGLGPWQGAGDPAGVGAKVGQMLNVSGSTDVLALCTDTPRPHERLLTRALGAGQRWVSVSTIAAAGSALEWVHGQFFRELSVAQFYTLVDDLEAKAIGDLPEFDPRMAGDRLSIEQATGSITRLTLGATRETILLALAKTLARQSAERVKLLAEVNAVRPRPLVYTSGGTGEALARLLYRDWPKRYHFERIDHATLRGLARLV